MNSIRRRLLGAAATAPAMGIPLARAQGHAFPVRPLTIVVPFTSGGGNDVLARAVAQPLAAKLGQSVIVDNKPGAGGNIGAQMVARSQPDGYTMLLATNTLTLNPFLLKTIPFDVARDLAPVARLANQPIVIVVNPKLQVKDVKELVAYAKAHAGKLAYASPGVGTPHHFAAELFKQVAGVEMTHVPYKGAAPALTDLISGEVQLMFASIISALPFIQSGRIRALATAEGKRLSVLKDVPTVRESAYPNYEATIWGGIMVAANTPAPVMKVLVDGLLGVMEMPDVKANMLNAGFELSPAGPDEFRKRVIDDLDQFGKVAKAAGMVPE